MADQTQQEQRYQELETSFAVMAEDGDRATIDGHLALYGTETNPATMVTVPPGGSIQILGSAPFAPVWERPPAPGTGMHLVAYLAINSARLRPRDAQGNRYRDDQRQLFRAVSSNELEISYREPQ